MTSVKEWVETMRTAICSLSKTDKKLCMLWFDENIPADLALRALVGLCLMSQNGRLALPFLAHINSSETIKLKKIMHALHEIFVYETTD